MKKVKITDKNGIVLQTANKHLDDDVFVTVDESIMGSGGVEINGLIEEYKVLAGENVNAGDFVEYLKNVSKQLNNAGGSSYLTPSCCLVDTNKVFIAHSYNNTYRELYGTIVTIDGINMTATTKQLSSVSYSCYTGVSCCLVDTNKVFIAHNYKTSMYLAGTIVTINGTTMTATLTQLNSTSQSCYGYPSCCLVDTNKVFIAHSYSSSNKYLYGTIVTIDGTSIVGTPVQLNERGNSYEREPSCCLLNTNKVFIAHTNGTNGYLYGSIVEINGTEMTITSTQLNSYYDSCYAVPSCCLLEENKVFIAHSYSDSNRYLYGTIVEINGTEMVGTSAKLNSVSQSCYDSPNCCLLENNKVFIAHVYGGSNKYLYGTIVEIDGTSMVGSSSQLNNSISSSNTVPDCCLVDKDKTFVSHSFTGSNFLYGTIALKEGGVKPTTDKISGIAKTSGTSGDIIQVYVPNNK